MPDADHSRSARSRWVLGPLIALDPLVAHGRLTLVVVSTAASWLALFSWDTARDMQGSAETGPYQPWQVIALIALLGAIGAVATLRGVAPLASSTAMAVTIAVGFTLSLTVLSPPDGGASLWPIGVALIAAVTFTGALAFTCAVTSLSQVRHHGTPVP